MVRSDSGIFYRAQRRPIVVDGIGIGIAADNTLLYELHIFPALHYLHWDFSQAKSYLLTQNYSSVDITKKLQRMGVGVINSAKEDTDKRQQEPTRTYAQHSTNCVQ